jgi:hypothetical protein
VQNSDHIVKLLSEAYNLAVNHPTSNNLYYLGSLVAVLKDRQQGFKILSTCDELEFGSIKIDHRMFNIQEDNFISKPLINISSSTEILANVSSIPKTLFVFAADEVYFNAYSEGLISTLIHFNPNSLIIAGLDADQSFYSYAFDKYSKYNNVRIIKTSRLIEADKNLPAYFSCLRYLLAEELGLLNVLPCKSKLVFLDIDLEQTRIMPYLIEESDPADFSLVCYTDQIGNIMSLCSGSCVIVSGKPHGRKFLMEILNFVKSCLQREIFSWHLDQVAIGYSFLGNRDANICHLPIDSISSEPFSHIQHFGSKNAFFRSFTGSISLPKGRLSNENDQR